VNGTPLLSGDGARVFAFTMGPSGKSTIVTLSVSPRSSTPFTRTFTFTPGAVTLLWEAQAYTPALYQGKPLYSAGSNIRVLALPQVTDAGGKPLQSADLNFKWQINGDAHADLSGIGRDTLDFTGSLLGGNEEVSVDILRRDGSKAAQGYTVVHDENPVVLLYKKDPLRGTLYNQALSGDVPLVDTETTIIAEPYFMSGTSRSSKDLAYEWQLNGAVVQPQGNDPSVLTLRRVGNESGNATLTLSLQNMDKSKLLQQANATLNIILDAARSTIFGQ
jgi:hypothetical protein